MKENWENLLSGYFKMMAKGGYQYRMICLFLQIKLLARKSKTWTKSTFTYLKHNQITYIKCKHDMHTSIF